MARGRRFTVNDVSNANDGPHDPAMQADTRQQVLQHAMLTTAEVDIQLGREWASAAELFAGRLICLPRHNQGGLIPAFQLDPKVGRVRPIVAECNLMLGALQDQWRAAAWWLTPAAALPEGVTPADVAMSGAPEAIALIRRMAQDFGGPPDGNTDPDDDPDRSIGRGARGHVLAHTTLNFAEADQVLGASGAAFGMAALERTLIALHTDAGTMLVPAFQLDVGRGRVRPLVSEINAIWRAGDDP